MNSRKFNARLGVLILIKLLALTFGASTYGNSSERNSGRNYRKTREINSNATRTFGQDNAEPAKGAKRSMVLTPEQLLNIIQNLPRIHGRIYGAASALACSDLEKYAAGVEQVSQYYSSTLSTASSSQAQNMRQIGAQVIQRMAAYRQYHTMDPMLANSHLRYCTGNFELRTSLMHRFIDGEQLLSTSISNSENPPASRAKKVGGGGPVTSNVPAFR